MSNEAVLLLDKDVPLLPITTTSVTLMVSSRWRKPLFREQTSPEDMITAALVRELGILAITDHTSPHTTLFPAIAPPPTLDTWVELDVSFPPKRTRTVRGRIVRKERAKFTTAFGDEFAE